MATSTYRDLFAGSRRVGMVLQNLSNWEVQIPPKTVISNVQMAKVVPDLKLFEPASLVLPQKEQVEWSKVSHSDGSKSHEKELTQLTPISPPLGPNVPTLGHDILKKVNLLGCAEWDPSDQQEGRQILAEYADVFAKDDLDLG